jgi:hypothetical protein
VIRYFQFSLFRVQHFKFTGKKTLAESNGIAFGVDHNVAKNAVLVAEDY